MTQPVITFLSDYGLDDDFVGVCHGVIATICPQARVIDITHGVRATTSARGALILRGALPYLPAGVHLAVVDPDVGAERRAVAMRLADDRLLVGPDNGLLSLAAELRRRGRRGGRHRALAVPARAGLGDLPRARHLRAGRRPARGRRAARRCRRTDATRTSW